MTQTYHFDGKSLVIVDTALGIAIDEPFCPQLLPSFEKLKSRREITIDTSASDQEISVGFRTEKGFEGQWRCFTLEGRLKAECYYRDGHLHGPSRFYDKSGQCLSESWFYSGLQHGKVERYYQSGALSALEHYVAGKREGQQTYYYSSGKIKTEMGYCNGKLEGEVHLFWPHGKKKRSCYFRAGEREGFDRIWSATGVLLDEGKYKAGAPIARHRCWHENGTLQSMRCYHAPDRFDSWQWDANGKPLYEAIFDDKLNCLEKRWREGKVHVRRGKWAQNQVEWEQP
ncbi:MAG: toxin-antitoxin system YwqK family antitoxin [Chlamydiota bacterium]